MSQLSLFARYFLNTIFIYGLWLHSKSYVGLPQSSVFVSSGVCNEWRVIMTNDEARQIYEWCISAPTQTHCYDHD